MSTKKKIIIAAIVLTVLIVTTVLLYKYWWVPNHKPAVDPNASTPANIRTLQQSPYTGQSSPNSSNQTAQSAA